MDRFFINLILLIIGIHSNSNCLFFKYKCLVQCLLDKVYDLIPRKFRLSVRVSGPWLILMWLYFLVDLTGNVSMIEKSVLGGT